MQLLHSSAGWRSPQFNYRYLCCTRTLPPPECMPRLLLQAICFGFFFFFICTLFAGFYQTSVPRSFRLPVNNLRQTYEQNYLPQEGSGFTWKLGGGMIATQMSKGIWEAEEINLTCSTHTWSVPASRTLPFIAWAGSSPWLKQEKARTLPCSPNWGKGICSTVPRRLWEICLSSSSWVPETNFSSLRCSTSRVRSCLPDVWPHLAGSCALPWGTAPR